MNIEIAKLLIEALAVILPSTITVATLLKKKYYKNSLEAISQKINNIQVSNETQMSVIQNDLKTHGLAVLEYTMQHDTSSKLRNITKHALQCCNDFNTKKILVKFTQQFIGFVQQILDLQLVNISKQQFIAKLHVAIDNTIFYAKQLVSNQHVQGWILLINKQIINYVDACLDLIFDKLNNKDNRFIVKSLDLAHTIVKEYVLYSANLDYDSTDIRV